jgi:transposase-like protein
MTAPRRPKRLLSPEQKYDLWVRMLTGQLSQADAAAEAGVDRSTIVKLRRVAKDGAIAGLTASTPGRPKQSAAEASEIAKLKAEVDRLGGVIVEQAVELTVLRGRTSWG